MARTKERKYRYPSPVKCPHCRGYNTYAVRTDNARGLQYRRCRAAICRGVKWSVRGIAVKDEAPAVDEALQCPHCPKVYQRQADLTKHINRNHRTGETNDGRADERE